MTSEIVHTFNLHYVTPDGVWRKKILTTFETEQELDKWAKSAIESGELFFKYEKVAVTDLKGEENDK